MRRSVTRTNAQTARRPRPAAALLATVLLALVSALILGCGDGGDDTATDATSPTTDTTAAQTGDGEAIECKEVPDDGGEEPCPATTENDPADVEVTTSEGDFTITLAVDESPATTTSFRHLVESGFYDGLTFNRVVPGFVIQGGDPLYDDPALAGTGGPGYYVDEEVPDGTTYERGVVAMAKAGTEPAGRSGSQFFVVSGPDAGLPPDYAFVGEVTEGLDTVAAIESLGVGDGPPRKEVTIDDMEVVGGS
jgi:peptidyl-prolyl cis-trans isomerase B (cyclophilin B)